jgi:flagellar basal body-associated protein FliL
MPVTEDPATPAAEPEDYSSVKRRPNLPVGRRGAIVAALTVVAAAGGAWLVFSGGRRHREVTVDLGPPPVVHAIGGFVVDLQPEAGRPHFLRLAIALEVDETDVPLVDARRARVIDAVKVKVRDYRHADLVGADGADRLRHDVLTAVNRTIAPARARRVLFQDFLLD